MNGLCLVTLVALTLGVVVGQELEKLPDIWLPDKFPNPIKNPGSCGLDTDMGYVCDPNRILSRLQRKTLNFFLEGIAETINLEECPCSRWHCENYPGQRFYKVAVALIPRLSIPRNTDGKEVTVLDQANTFAYRLENDVWNISTCEEDIVILYSVYDRALVTMTGKTAGRKLNPAARTAIHAIVGDHFNEGRINEGLERMVYEIQLVLNGKMKYYDFLGAQVGDTGDHLLGSPLLLLLPLASVWLARSVASAP